MVEGKPPPPRNRPPFLIILRRLLLTKDLEQGVGRFIPRAGGPNDFMRCQETQPGLNKISLMSIRRSLVKALEFLRPLRT